MVASLRSSMLNSSGGSAVFAPRTPAERVFEHYVALSDSEQTAFDALWREHHARLALPQLPLLVWQHIVDFLAFRDRLTLRCAFLQKFSLGFFVFTEIAFS